MSIRPVYLDAKFRPNWNRIIVAGHSQAGGNAAFIGKKRATAGVIMFSSVDYCSALDKLAPWIAAKGVTPSSCYSALRHMRDQAFPLAFFVNVIQNGARMVCEQIENGIPAIGRYPEKREPVFQYLIFLLQPPRLH